MFVERLEFCHTIEVAGRLDAHPVTIGLEELLLQKLQIIEMTTTDVIDAGALLATHDVSERRRTTRGDRRRPHRRAARPRLGLPPHRHPQPAAGPRPRRRTAGTDFGPEANALVRARADRLLDAIDAEPKNARWRMRDQDRRAQAVVAGRRRQGGDVLMGLLRRKPPPPRSEASGPSSSPPTCTAPRCASGSSWPRRSSTAPTPCCSAATSARKIVVPIVERRDWTGTRPSSTATTRADRRQHGRRLRAAGRRTAACTPSGWSRTSTSTTPTTRRQVEALFVRVMRRHRAAAGSSTRKTKLGRQPGDHLQRAGQRRPAEVDEVLLEHGDARVRFVEGRDHRAGSRHGDAEHRVHQRHAVGHAPRVQRGRDPRAPDGDDRPAGATRDRASSTSTSRRTTRGWTPRRCSART